MNEVKGTILIVDDEESIRSILSRRLESEGYKCEVAADGKEALWKAFIRDFDLVLMDVKMPGMSGMEALPQMVTNHPDTCVLMLTALVDTENAVEAMKLGAYDYLTKPFDLDDLTMRVDKALERRRLLLENREYHLNLEQKVKQQTEQIHQYYQDAIQALSREQIAVEELQATRTIKQPKVEPGEEVAARAGEPSGTAKDLAKKLAQLFNRGEANLPGEKGEAASAQTVATTERPQAQIASGQDTGASAASYEGTVELAISPPVSLWQMLQLYEHLKAVSQLEVLDVGGSADEDVSLKLLLKAPTPLSKILWDLPEVEMVSEESGGDGASAAEQKGDTPVTRIVVGLSAKNLSPP